MHLCAALDAWVLSTVLTACALVELTALAFLGAAPEAITGSLMADGALMLICATYEIASASACSIRARYLGC